MLEYTRITMKKFFSLACVLFALALAFTSCKPKPNGPEPVEYETVYASYAMNYGDWYKENTTYFILTLGDEKYATTSCGKVFSIEFFAPADCDYPPVGTYPFNTSCEPMTVLAGYVNAAGTAVFGSTVMDYVQSTPDYETRELLEEGTMEVIAGPDGSEYHIDFTYDGETRHFKVFVPNGGWYKEEW